MTVDYKMTGNNMKQSDSSGGFVFFEANVVSFFPFSIY